MHPIKLSLSPSSTLLSARTGGATHPPAPRHAPPRAQASCIVQTFMWLCCARMALLRAAA